MFIAKAKIVDDHAHTILTTTSNLSESVQFSIKLNTMLGMEEEAIHKDGMRKVNDMIISYRKK